MQNSKGITQFLTENAILIAGLSIMGIGFMSQGGMDAIKAQNSIGQGLRQQRIDASNELAESRISEEALTRASEIAKQRIDSGNCHPIFSGNYQVAVSEGLPVADSQGFPLPDGMCLLDHYGNTGIVKGGVVTDVKTYRNVTDNETAPMG